MNLADYFDPVDSGIFDSIHAAAHDDLIHHVRIYTEKEKFPSDAEADIVLIGVNEFRGAELLMANINAADAFRKHFYSLKKHSNPCRIVDIGNFITGNSVEDTYFALASVLTELMQKNMLPVIIGGSQDLTYAQYKAYENLEQLFNLVSIDSRFDLGGPDDPMNASTYIGKIVLKQPNYLFNYSNIGHQTYYVGQEQVQLMERLYFDAYRLGQVRTDLKETEPIIRTADVLSVDMSAIRQSDAPASLKPSPNGFYGEEACQFMMYAGMSDKLSNAGIFEFNTSDHRQQTAGLVAQMVWYLIEGFSNRKNDLPGKNLEQSFTIYRVPVSGNKHEIVFLKSNKTERWWIELPGERLTNKFLRNHFLPCSYKDYQQAISNEVPDRWWMAIQKMSV